MAFILMVFLNDDINVIPLSMIILTIAPASG